MRIGEMDHSQDSAIAAAAVLEEQNQQEEEQAVQLQEQQPQQQQQQQQQQQSRDRDSNNKALPTHAMPCQQEHQPSTSRDEVGLTVNHPGIGTV